MRARQIDGVRVGQAGAERGGAAEDVEVARQAGVVDENVEPPVLRSDGRNANSMDASKRRSS